MPTDKTLPGGLRILLTGGAGFLGSAILQELLEDNAAPALEELRVLDIKTPKQRFAQQITFIQGDVRNPELVKEACKGIDLVVHSAAIVDWGTKSKSEIMAVNFEGTLNVIEACRLQKVKALVFTSSLDVLFNGQPLINVNEETAYPDHHSTSYCESKYLAEVKVLEASDGSLKTCSLRPADIYGEGDPYHIGSLVDMAKGGFYVRLGNNKSLCQHVYVGNAAQAHILAGLALLNGNEVVSGQAYFLTDGPGTNFFSFFDRFVEGAGYRIWPKNLWLPRRFAYVLGSISEAIAFLLRPVRKYSPKMSRFAVTYTCTTYTFNADKAKRDFGFVPKYSSSEAFDRSMEDLRSANR
jgi:nucleoside-diphosphate-sugar epimerase